MDVAWGTLIMGLAGGLALFLIGMAEVTDALKALGDDRLRWALARLSSNRLLGATTGGVVTAVIQSSSVTTVLTVGFVSAGLLSLTQAASVIIGANLGTTVTAQVIALKITDYALALLAVGALLGVSVKRRQVRYMGSAVAGLGFVFLGMDIMSDAMSPLRSYDPFLRLMSDATNPLTAVAMGVAFTGLVQSSSATTGIVVVMAADGLISLETAIAIILGANIGTCVTALLAAIGKGSEAFRTAMVHVGVNVIGASIAVFFIPQIAAVVESISTSEVNASPRQIANAHTLFNMANTAVFLVFLTPLVTLVRRIVPDRAGRIAGEGQAAFLDEDLIDTPVLALEMVHKEVMRMGLKARELLADAVPAAIDGRRAELDALVEREQNIDELHAQILDYLGAVGQRRLGPDQRDDMLSMLAAANAVEQLSDTIESQVINKGYQRLENIVEVSESTRELLDELHAAALDTLDLSLVAVGERSWKLTKQVLKTKSGFRDLEAETSRHLAERLAAPEGGRVETYSFEIELMEALDLVHRNCRRIVRALRLPDKPD
ncbi:MAG: Na/Pi cotransporter family protein [Acidimicrobiia bacterium]|nr:Na/Pi cotransporter family protein [Acidimicrobiia bacterium]